MFPFLIAALTCALYYHFFVNKAYVSLELEVDRKAEFMMSWQDSGQPYCEEKRVKVVVTPHSRNYHFFLTDIGQVRKIQINTHSYRGDVTLRSLVIQQEGWKPLSLTSSEELKLIEPRNQIGDYHVDKTGIHVTSTGEESNLELSILPERQRREIGWMVFRFMAISGGVFLTLKGTAGWVKDLRFVPLLLFGAWLLIIVMAGISQPDSHPDEYSHETAVSYYRNHWLPPQIEDPTVRNTYSIYGFSRLNNGEVYYLFAGKFNKLLDEFRFSNIFSLRVFNVLLFGLLVLSGIKNQYARMVALPFLISPQVWYLFSYCNSDAFALFCTFLAGWQLVDPKSHLHHVLQDEKSSSMVVGVVVFSLFVAVLFLLKKNYYSFLLFFYFCLSLQLWMLEDEIGERGRAMKRVAIIVLAGLLIFGGRIVSDYMVNGLDRQGKIAKMQEKTALPILKASTDPNNKHFEIDLKGRGVGLREMIHKYHWIERSLRSSFGVFGHFTINAPDIYYNLARWVCTSLLLFVCGSIFWKGGFSGRNMVIAALALSLALIGASIYHSWTADLEPQGRYLLPIIPIFGILYAANYEAVNHRILVLGVVFMYGIGIYSFIFQALMRIPKIVIQ